MITRRTFLVAASATALASSLAGSALAQMASRSGTFEGRSNHTTSGGVTFDGKTVTLGDDFALDNGPDPIVTLGKDGTYDPDTNMGDLATLTGGQTYSLPEGVDGDAYNEVYIWCRAAGVPLGVASLN